MKKRSWIVGVTSVFVVSILLFTTVKTKANQEQVLQITDNEKLKNSIVLFVGSAKALVNNDEFMVDAENSLVSPYVKTNSTLVPVRFISEKLGAKVIWDDKTQTITIVKSSKHITLKLGSSNMIVNNAKVRLEVTAEIQNERTFVPLRKIAEALDKKVFYDRGLIIISDKDNIFDVNKEKASLDKIINKVNNLPTIQSFDNFKKIMKKFEVANNYNNGGIMRTMNSSILNDTVKSVQPQMSEKSSNNNDKNTDFSKTNVQVEGVDEGDVVKTDGEYIYQVNENKIIIAKAIPAENMKIEAKLDFTNDKFTPAEMYVDDKRLIVVGNIYKESNYVQSDQPQNNMKMMPYYVSNQFTKVISFDIKDKTNPIKERELEIEGNYISSRKIGSSVYVITDKYIYYNILKDSNGDEFRPLYKDSIKSSDYKKVDFNDIKYFPNIMSPNYMLVAGIDFDKPTETVKISSYLGAGQEIYSSLNNLYVTMTNYNYEIQPLLGVQVAATTVQIMPPRINIETTSIYKFSLNNGEVTFLYKGEAPGRIINQFSMDENGKYFRIATTTGESWNRTDNISKNNLYILDETLKITGTLEGIAPGERIYSTRFIGDRVYMVTFKNTDPLFVIDLKDASNPKILGALKIPGFSDYLHPYDENHIIGFGKDTEEVKDFAYTKGIKIALFDVSDVANPKQEFQEIIGVRGTDSELLRNHKALLFSKDKNLLAFPITVYEKTDGSVQNTPDYGQFTYQGAYVYNIDLQKGFSLKGKITHLTDEDYKKSGQYGFDYEKNIDRILYIDNNLYTLSKTTLKANKISDLKQTGELTLK